MHLTQSRIEIFLQPGEYFVGDADYRIRTLLGSCVSIMLWHPARRIGAMSHFLLARRDMKPVSEFDARYGEEAMWLMVRELGRMGVAASDCQGKIFGGGEMFPHHARAHVINVGKNNGETARDLLRAHGIPIISESLFGIGHRQIIFDVNSGHVWSRQVNTADSNLLNMKVKGFT